METVELEEARDDNDLDELFKKIQRDVNCLSDDNRSARKRSLEKIRKETLQTSCRSASAAQKLTDRLLKPLLKVVSDPVEKCRELALNLIRDLCDGCVDVVAPSFLPYLLPVAVARLGMPDIVEPSEELRLVFVCFLLRFIEQCSIQSSLAAYLDDFIKILQRLIVDPYPEVKKESCRLCMTLAPKIPETFHMQAETLVVPLISTLTHQRYKVRVTCVKAIGVVGQFGNAKCLDSFLPHLAQRTFDHSPPVRSCLTDIIGHWLLDFQDRYSFHHKLSPLLLSGFTDELVEIRQKSYGLMEQVGQKYAQENEEDLKDQSDFSKPVSPDYSWGEFPRPCLGTRVLLYRCLSKILPAAIRDMGDWNASTRLKAISLLEVLLVHAEDNATQHAEILLQSLYKACQDEEAPIVDKATKCARLLGHYVDPEVLCRLVLPAVLTSSGAGDGKVKASVAVSSRVCTGCLAVLGAILRGADTSKLQDSIVQGIVETLMEPEVRFSQHSSLLKQILFIVQCLIEVDRRPQGVEYDLFVLLLSLISHAGSGDESGDIRDQAENVLGGLATSLGYSRSDRLFLLHSRKLLDNLKERHLIWIASSPERRLFDVLLTRARDDESHSPLVESLDVFEHGLGVERDPETKLSFFSLLSRLLASNRDPNGGALRQQSLRVIRDMILPNCIWSSGRTAAAIRTAAMTCMRTLIQSGNVEANVIRPIENVLFAQVLSCLDDTNLSTRSVSCKVLQQILTLYKGEIDVDRLNQLYVDLLKRMDDSSNDVRLSTTETLIAYFECFPLDRYDRTLYRAHVEAIYKGLLVHLDDPASDIQEAVLRALKASARLWPEKLKEQLDLVRHKHRMDDYCDDLGAWLDRLLIDGV